MGGVTVQREALALQRQVELVAMLGVLAIQLPERMRTVHVIRTGDPAGIENGLPRWDGHCRFPSTEVHVIDASRTL